jgi:hypothetical protein
MSDVRKPPSGRSSGSGGTTTRRPPTPKGGKRPPPEGNDPGLLTRIERVARSFGVELPRAPKSGEAANAATAAAGFLASDPEAQRAGGVVITLVDAEGEVVRERAFGRRPRRR